MEGAAKALSLLEEATTVGAKVFHGLSEGLMERNTLKKARHGLAAMLARMTGVQSPAQAAVEFYAQFAAQRGFHTDTLPSLVADGWRSARCLFVLSTGRTGTMQLTAALNSSPDIVALHEPAPTLIHLASKAYAECAVGAHWRLVMHAIRDEYIALACHLSRVYAETNNRLTFVAPALAEAFPASRFIHLHRHPYEVIRSGLHRGWYEGSGMDYSLVCPRPADPFARHWEAMAAAEKIAWFWLRVNGEAKTFLENLPKDRSMTLSATDLFHCNWSALESIFGFAGAQVPSKKSLLRVLRRHLNATPRSSLVRRRRWSNDAQLAAKGVVEPLASELGYDL